MPPPLRDPRLTVRFDLLSRETTNIKSYSLSSNYMQATDGWSFELFEADRRLSNDLGLQPVELFINGNSQVMGRVDVTSQGHSGTAVTCRGRDYLADMTECHVDPSLRLKKSITIADAITFAAGPVGITEVVNDSETLLRDVRTGRAIRVSDPGQDRKKVKLDDYKPKPGETIFEFLDRPTARQGATMQPGRKRNQVVIGAPNYAQDPAYRIERRLGSTSAGNNVLSATATRDFSSFPTFVLATGKETRPGKTTAPIFQTVDVLGVVFTVQVVAGSAPPAAAQSANPLGIPDTGNLIHEGRIRPSEGAKTTPGLYRLNYQRDQDSRNQAELDRAALRTMAERLRDTLKYEVTLRGHEDPDTGRTFAVDTFVEVADEVCDVRETLWVEARRFEYSESGGATTNLTCWRPGTFLI